MAMRIPDLNPKARTADASPRQKANKSKTKSPEILQNQIFRLPLDPESAPPEDGAERIL